MLESSPLGVACLMSSGGGSRAAPTVLLDPVGNASCLSLYCYCSNILHYQLSFSELMACPLVRWEVPGCGYGANR